MEFIHAVQEYWAHMSNVELIALCLNVVYIYLIARENIWGWVFGIGGSLFGMYYIWTHDHLLFQTLLYGYYAVMGVVGIYEWRKGATADAERPVVRGPLKFHLIAIPPILIAGLVAGFYQNNWQSFDLIACMDLAITMISVLATTMIPWKWIDNWFYWLVVDISSMYLYARSGSYGLVLQYIVYAIFSVQGIFFWRKNLKKPD